MGKLMWFFTVKKTPLSMSFETPVFQNPEHIFGSYPAIYGVKNAEWLLNKWKVLWIYLYISPVLMLNYVCMSCLQCCILWCTFVISFSLSSDCPARQSVSILHIKLEPLHYSHPINFLSHFLSVVGLVFLYVI